MAGRAPYQRRPDPCDEVLQGHGRGGTDALWMAEVPIDAVRERQAPLRLVEKLVVRAFGGDGRRADEACRVHKAGIGPPAAVRSFQGGRSQYSTSAKTCMPLVIQMLEVSLILFLRCLQASRPRNLPPGTRTSPTWDEVSIAHRHESGWVLVNVATPTDCWRLAAS